MITKRGFVLRGNYFCEKYIIRSAIGKKKEKRKRKRQKNVRDNEKKKESEK